MKEKKYIDRLYQEKFRDFEAAPREAVWKNIEAKLQEKKKRRTVVPLWYRYAGVAALMAFLLMLGDWILPISPSAAVANEETEETNITPLNSPAAPVVIPLSTSEERIAISENSTEASEESTPVIASSAAQQQRSAEETASKITLKNAIFDTPVAAAVVPLQKKKKNTTPQDLKPSIFDEITPSKDPELAENQRKSIFEVSTHATPIYYGKMGDVNPLDVGSNDSRQAEVTYSYGVRLAMNISDRVQIRSGVNRVDLSYSSSGRGYRSASGVYAVRNASLVKDYDPEVKMVTGSVNGRTNSSTNRTQAGIFTQGNLSQKMGYIEVPVEFEINLFQSKLELNLIGGGSTLFLEENEVTLTSGPVTAAGKADNLNEVSFSANLGVGLDYNLSEKFKINLEPMFKYQVKTFETPTGDVKPYFLGIYTGVSYKF